MNVRAWPSDAILTYVSHLRVFGEILCHHPHGTTWILPWVYQFVCGNLGVILILKWWSLFVGWFVFATKLIPSVFADG